MIKQGHIDYGSKCQFIKDGFRIKLAAKVVVRQNRNACFCHCDDEAPVLDMTTKDMTSRVGCADMKMSFMWKRGPASVNISVFTLAYCRSRHAGEPYLGSNQAANSLQYKNSERTIFGNTDSRAAM